MTYFYINILNMMQVMQVIGSYKLVLPQIELIQVLLPFAPVSKRTLLSSRPLPLAFPPILGIVNSIGVGIGGRAFHSSIILLNHLNNEEVSQPFVELEKGLTQWAPEQIIPRGGGWYVTYIVAPGQPTFWLELEALLRVLQPGEKFGILLQPTFENGQRVTLGESFHVDNTSNIELIKEHFESIITKMEEDYDQ